MWFKMEPPIVAIRARNIEAARRLLNTARANGLKNCGIRSINADSTVSFPFQTKYLTSHLPFCIFRQW